MAKQLMFDEDARGKALLGIQQLARAVKTTLGPSGRNVLLDKKFGAPQATRDGATVSKEIELEDPFENVGAKLANAAADKTNDTAGDGTTTAVVLAEAIYSEGVKSLMAGCNPMALKRGIDRGVEVAVEEFKRLSRPAKGIADYRNVALVSSHFDEGIADQVSKAMDKVGKEGVITVEESKGFETVMEFVEGLQIDKGFISPHFINKPDSLTAEYEDVYLLLTDRKISNVKEFVPILERVAQTGKPLLIIAEEVEGEALAALVVNRLRGVLRVVAVKAPAFGDRRKAILEDIAIVTGGCVVSDDLGLKLESLRLDQLGRAKKVHVEKEKCTIISGAGDPKGIQNRLAEIRTLIKKTTSDYDREKYEERLAKLLGGVAVVKVGGATEAEIKERKFRVDDAVHAVKAAAEEGVGPGGGILYLRAARAVEALKLGGDESVGVRILAKALEAPLYHIALNAGHDASAVVYEAKEKGSNIGCDARTGQWQDLFEAGILDPVKVCRSALQNAASMAGMLLTSKAILVELKDKKKATVGAMK